MKGASMRLLLQVVLLLLPLSSAAYTIDLSCRMVFGTDGAEGDPFVAIIGRPADGEAVEVCSSEGKTWHVLHYPPVRGPLGACTTTARSINRRPSGDGPTWAFSESWRRMARPESGGTCPAQGDSKYVIVDYVSEGVFLSVAGFWDRVRSSPRTLDDSSSRASDLDRSSGAFDSLRRALKATGADVQLARLAVHEGDTDELPRLALEVTNGKRTWEIRADILDGKVEVFSVAEVEY